MIRTVVALTAALLLSSVCFAECIPFEQARKHIGEDQCIAGKVVRVEAGNGGVHYLDFCEDHRLCPFSVVVFSYDLKHVGDVRQLAGRIVNIRGEIKEYDGRAEIVLENAHQLGGGGAGASPLPKSFDVEERGHFSAGKFRASKRRPTRNKKGRPTLPADIPEDVESDLQ